MVVERRSSNTLEILKASDGVSAKYFYTAATHSLAIYPMNFKESPTGYTSPILYIILIASINSCIYSIGRSLVKPILNHDIAQYMLLYLMCTSIWAISYILMVLLVSYLDSLIMKFDHSSQQFGMLASALTLLPILTIIFQFKNPIVQNILSLAAILLMNYYITSSYSASITHESNRTATIGSIISFVYCAFFCHLSYLILASGEDIYRNLSNPAA